ncbi:protein phosphatase 1 regulatory subunit 3D [Microcaecilia unicolor]|uniref:Protein phosphatase 1 regulatory subunit 3D n=1 Tax=Microcaecilia unicolor TaxID=1415580 RepID=A0A6P7Z369_9AMPH|nr:protein phosphatase 1 regulatory subunit 3D [Microcaecilia unicolor]
MLGGPESPGRGSTASCDPHVRPILGRRRRTRSLPTSPERRRAARCLPRCSQVRFADSLGLELAEVKLFSAADDPSVPLHVLTRLAINSALCCSGDLQLPFRYVEPDFPQPADRADFQARLQRQRISLERVLSSQELGVAGTVRVLNVAFHKTVAVRYTVSEWRSQQEARAVWQSGGAASDLFAFCLPVPPFLLQPGSALRFAVRYQVGGEEYWDNNDGQNYSLLCRSQALRMPRDSEQSWIHFV